MSENTHTMIYYDIYDILCKAYFVHKLSDITFSAGLT